MPEDLVILGQTFNGVTGIISTDDNGDEQIYVKGGEVQPIDIIETTSVSCVAEGNYYTDRFMRVGADMPAVYTDSLDVTFDGNTYTVLYDNDSYGWGAPWDENLDNFDFTDYPFFIEIYTDQTTYDSVYLATGTSGAHTIAAVGKRKAVDNVHPIVLHYDVDQQVVTCNKTYAEVYAMVSDGNYAAVLEAELSGGELIYYGLRASFPALNDPIEFANCSVNGYPDTYVVYNSNGTITYSTDINDFSAITTGSITTNGTHTPTQGYLWKGVTVSVSAPTPNLQAKTNIAPTTSSQTITADSGYDGLSSVQINAMPSGSATASATKGVVSNHSVTVTPSVTRTAGYITAGTSNGTAVTVSASELVSGSETKTQNGTYNVTNLASLVVAVPIVTYYTGSSAPSSSLGSNGDIYLQT